jgi:DedD protein
LDERLKRRLVGAGVLVSLAVIFLPMLVEERDGGEVRIETSNVPPEPPAHREFQSSILPLAEEASAALPPILPASPPSAEAGATGNVAETEDEAPARPKLGVSAWVIQVASLSNQANADALAAKLRQAGFDAFVEQAYVDERNLYRIRVGPEIDRARADRSAGRILEQFNLKGQVIRYP